MRIVIDLQGAQTSGSRFRGIGRYSLALAQEMARQAGTHEVWLALNGLFRDAIEPLRAAFDGLIPQEHILVWEAPGPVADADPANRWRREVGERLREAFLAGLKPDVVHVSSLFEGCGDDAITSVGVLKNDLPTAVTLHDLIPLIHRKLYLENPVVESWYKRKLGSFRRASLWLANSESSRQEGIDWLSLPHEWVVNVSAAADAMFRPIQLDAEQEHAIRWRYGLTRPFVMYTGGIDYRKNIEGLIAAYAKLPASIRTGHQLAIVCAAQDADKVRLRALATQRALAPEEVVFTGFIQDADMVALYNLCTVFVFPSWHEGFGLPALEAMQCGAAVIGANTSSLPEVIGRSDALFDPYAENDIAASLFAVLTDDAFRQTLQRHGQEQARKFSWSVSARRALEGFERLHAHNQAHQAIRVARAGSRRPSLAYVSPLPPGKSGIADYSAELLPELARHYDIDVIVDQPEVADPWIRANCPIRDTAWFYAHAWRYDRILYHFGNSMFHQHMLGMLERHPGTVVLHDFFLSGLIAQLDAHGFVPGAWTAALYASHGYPAVRESFAGKDPAEAVMKYPANLVVLQRANGIIVHSEYSRALADRWYGEGFGADWAVLPLLRKPVVETNRSAARAALGLQEGDFLLCSFGMLHPTKLNHRLLQAWLAWPPTQDARCHLAFVGENDGGEYAANLARSIAENASTHRIRLTGFAPQELFRRYLAAADAAVQLRTLSRGETSGSVLDCMNYGLSTIVNAHGALAELPPDCVVQLPDEFSGRELQAALMQLWGDPPLRQALGARALGWVRTHHHPRTVADQYRDAIERFARSGPQVLAARLMDAVAGLEAEPVDEREWINVAKAVAKNHPSPGRQKQLLVDVSELVQRDAKSAIQRVVCSVLNELLANPPAGYRVEPVYGMEDGLYHYARGFTLSFLGCPGLALADETIEAGRGDIFLGLALAPQVVPRCASVYAELRQQGVEVFFVVYDSLFDRPDAFVVGAFEAHSLWLRHVAELGDGALCISRAVADELAEWLDSTQAKRHRPLKIGWFHLGADVASGLPTGGVAPGFEGMVQDLRARPCVLMVGTVEPCKGYAQSLAAFDLLWQREVDANLVIVGNPGPCVELLIERLRTHPEAGKRLFWFEGVSDEALLSLYETCDGLLMVSEGEGFGLPLLETARPQRPILARDLSVLREVAGEHASYFSGMSPEALADALAAWVDELGAGSAPASDGIPWLTLAESTRQLTDIILGGGWQAQWEAGNRYRLRGSSRRLHSQVGQRYPWGVRANGAPGCLLYGPYMPITAGAYELIVFGQAVQAAGARVDVACAGGMQVLVEDGIETRHGACDEEHPIARVRFVVSQACDDLEIRIWVTEESNLTVTRYEIVPHATDWS